MYITLEKELTPWDVIDLENPETLNKYIRRQKFPFKERKEQQDKTIFASNNENERVNRVFKLNSLDEIPTRLYGHKVYLYLKDYENTIVIRHLFINIINGKVLADYDIDKYQVIGYCEDLVL